MAENLNRMSGNARKKMRLLQCLCSEMSAGCRCKIFYCAACRTDDRMLMAVIICKRIIFFMPADGCADDQIGAYERV